MNKKTRPFDIAAHLQTEDDIRGFLKEIVATGDTIDLISALNTAARAKGMTTLAKQIGMTRAGLYRSLSPEGNPEFKTIKNIVEALGCHLVID